MNQCNSVIVMPWVGDERDCMGRSWDCSDGACVREHVCVCVQCECAIWWCQCVQEQLGGVCVDPLRDSVGR